jgi:hypothetical protein
MMDWRSSGILHSLEYMSVDPLTGQDKALVGNVLDGGAINWDWLTSLKLRATVPYVGPWALGNDWLRVYAASSLGDERERTALGTFMASTPGYSVQGAYRTGEAQLYSVLQMLMEQVVEGILTSPAGTNAVTYAASMARSCGLTVIADASAYTLSRPAVFGVDDEGDDTMLSVANSLLAYAGFASADVDGYGNVLLRRYVNPADASPTVTFAADSRSIVTRDPVWVDFDAFAVPNRFVAACSNEDGCMVAVAVNDDPDSPYSTVSRGRAIAMRETVSDIASQDALQALAERRLAEVSSAVERVTFRHNYTPYRVGDAIALEYPGLTRHLGSVNADLTLDYTLAMSTTGRRFIR